MSGWTEPGETAEHMEFVRGYWRKIAQWTEGFYVNSYTAEEVARVRANFRGNYPHLVALKRKYDPGNLSRLNFNIAPDG